MKISNSLPIFLFFIMFLIQALLGQSLVKPPLEISMQESAVNFNDKFAKIANFGHGRLVGAVTWVLTLIEGDIEHYNHKDSNSWMFHRFKSISIYDPGFYENYRYGGQYLSIIKDDLSGAEYIYDKGLKLFPKDYWLNYHAGFHFYFEMGKVDKAIKNFETILSLPNAINRYPILPSLLTKIKVSKGKEQDAFDSLLALYNELPEKHHQKEQLYLVLYSVKAKIDLKCLNLNRLDCDVIDLDGKAYIKKEGLYTSNRSLLSLGLKNRK